MSSLLLHHMYVLLTSRFAADGCSFICRGCIDFCQQWEHHWRRKSCSTVLRNIPLWEFIQHANTQTTHPVELHRCTQTMCERAYDMWEYMSHIGVSRGGGGGDGRTLCIKLNVSWFGAQCIWFWRFGPVLLYDSEHLHYKATLWRSEHFFVLVDFCVLCTGGKTGSYGTSIIALFRLQIQNMSW